MKPFFAFLTRGFIHQEALWAQYLSSHPHYLYMHSADGTYTGKYLDPILVKTVENRYEFTMRAHFALFEAALNTDTDYLILLSESCIPLQNYYTLIKSLQDLDYKSGLTRYGPPYWSPYSPVRKYPVQYKQWEMGQEQWMIISRYHLELLITYRDELLKAYDKCGAYFPDETYFATLMNRLDRNDEIVSKKWWEIDWKAQYGHPRIYKEVDLLNYRDSLFLRKVNSKTIIHNIQKII